MTIEAPEREPVLLAVEGAPTLFVFWCPGCKYGHHLDTVRWKFNGDMHEPTALPSILVNADKREDFPRCHLFMRDGQLRFLSDSTHDLAGRTVAMIPYP